MLLPPSSNDRVPGCGVLSPTPAELAAAAAAAEAAAAERAPSVPPEATIAAFCIAIAHAFISAGESAQRKRLAQGVSSSKQLLRCTLGNCGKMHAAA